MAKLKGGIDQNLTSNIVQFVIHLCKTGQKITLGALLILHGLIYVNEANFQVYMNDLHPIICDAIVSKDGTVGRIACGLVSDLSNYFEKGMI